MQHSVATGFILAALISPLGLIAAPLPADAGARIDAYLAARSAMGGFSGAVLVVQDGKTVLRKGYGYADLVTRRPYTPDTQHPVASVSKMFTAMAALKLRDAGKLKLDDPICRYLQACPAAWAAITVQELMHHSSGIPDYESRLGIGSPAYEAFMVRRDATADIYADAKTRPLDFTPGTKFNYSNTGYIVLAMVVQAASGEHFASYVTRSLLKPAGMTHSGVLGLGPRPGALDTGYTFGDLGWDKLLGGFALTDGTLKPVPDLALTPPAGDAWLYATVDDLERWSRIMDGSTVVPTAEAQEVFTPGADGYGDGWVVDTSGDQREFEHTGALPGLTTDFVKLPDSKLTLILFCNLDRARMESIHNTLISIMQGKPYDMPVRGKPVKLADADYTRLMGSYRMADGTPLIVGHDDALLTAELKGHYQAGLIPLSATEFYFPLGDGEALFTLDAGGKVTSVDMHYHGIDHIAARED
jgi:CubicO group peptidase (beta-lactamase class C family)